MTNMSDQFSEKFPELIERRENREFKYLYDLDCGELMETSDINEVCVVKKEEVEKHCLSKQKVRDAIKKIRINWVNDSYDFEAKLRKELGLEEDD